MPIENIQIESNTIIDLIFTTSCVIVRPAIIVLSDNEEGKGKTYKSYRIEKGF